MALAFSQAPGLVVADTKLDLTVDPGGFLARSLSLWDPSAAFGQLQNQAYGYLFPMGPFFWAGDLIGMPAWITQRLWWSALLIVAFLGMWRLSAALVVASPWARLVGSIAYALSPRILAELTVTSIEVWPMAVAPWVLWPLVERSERSWRWRVTRSALAVACLGGVNAVASGVALVLPAVWFLTRRPSRRIARAAVAWLACSAAAIAWWLIPLVILGRYSPPFLDWIEGIDVTASTASVFESLRGTSAWLGFLLTANGPTWPGGYLFVTQSALIVASVITVGLGLAGLTLKGRMREPLFLGLAIMLGLVLLTAGHEGAVRSVVSGEVRQALDGVLAPLRNLHKFDLMLRLPLALGLMAAVDAGAQLALRKRLLPWVIPVGAALAVVAVTSPVLVGQLARPEGYRELPEYWTDAAEWLDAQPAEGAVLMLPASSFADFEWGSTKDNPLQPLLGRPFVHRDAVPLGSIGATRFLDGLQTELGSGRGGPHVRDTLAQAGIRFVLVPNDLRLDAAGDDLVRIHAGLQKSGLTPVASFGHTASTLADTPDQTVNLRTVLERPRLQVFDVGRAVAAFSVPEDDLPAAFAGGENMLSLSRQLDEPAYIFTGDPAGVDVVTDGRTRRETDFGRVTNNRSHLFAATEEARQDRPVWNPTTHPLGSETVQGWDGIAGVTASSSASDADSTLRLGPGYGPAAAFDGDPRTGWISGGLGAARGEYLDIAFAQPTRLEAVRVQTLRDDRLGAPPARVAFETESGTITREVFPNGVVEVQLSDSVTTWLRVRLDAIGPGVENAFGIAEIDIDDRLIAPRTVVPPVEEPAAILLSREFPGTPACVHVDEETRCNPEAERLSEERSALRREVAVEEDTDFTASGWVTPASSSALDDFLDHPDGIRARASSRLVEGPWVRPGAAFDGDLGTGWVAGADDFRPRLTIDLPAARRISGLQFVRGPALAASRPKEIVLQLGDGSVLSATVDEEGYVTFPARTVNRVSVRFAETYPLVSISSRTGQRSFAPVGASEVRLLGAEDLNIQLPGESATGAACGFGPPIFVNGQEFSTRVSGTIEDLRSGDRLRWDLCGQDSLPLVSGRNTVDLTSSGEFVPDSVLLQPEGRPADAIPMSAAALERITPSNLSVSVAASDDAQIVVVPQNYNPGWRASTGDGTVVEPVRVNDWMQGWTVPPGTSELQARFVPTAAYRAGLVIGAGLLVFLGLAGLGSGGSRHSPPAPLSIPRLPGFALVVVAAAFIGGWLLVALSFVIAGLSATVLRAPETGVPRSFRTLLVMFLPIVAGVVVALEPWPSGTTNLDSVVVQCVAFSAAALATLTMFENGRRGPRSTRARVRPADATAEPSA